MIEIKELKDIEAYLNQQQPLDNEMLLHITRLIFEHDNVDEALMLLDNNMLRSSLDESHYGDDVQILEEPTTLPLHIAVECYQSCSQDELLDRFYDKSQPWITLQKNASGKSALDIACELRNEWVVRYLLSNFCEFNDSIFQNAVSMDAVSIDEDQATFYDVLNCRYRRHIKDKIENQAENEFGLLYTLMEDNTSTNPFVVAIKLNHMEFIKLYVALNFPLTQDHLTLAGEGNRPDAVALIKLTLSFDGFFEKFTGSQDSDLFATLLAEQQINLLLMLSDKADVFSCLHRKVHCDESLATLVSRIGKCFYRLMQAEDDSGKNFLFNIFILLRHKRHEYLGLYFKTLLRSIILKGCADFESVDFIISNYCALSSNKEYFGFDYDVSFDALNDAYSFAGAVKALEDDCVRFRLPRSSDFDELLFCRLRFADSCVWLFEVSEPGDENLIDLVLKDQKYNHLWLALGAAGVMPGQVIADEQLKQKITLILILADQNREFFIASIWQDNHLFEYLCLEFERISRTVYEVNDIDNYDCSTEDSSDDNYSETEEDGNDFYYCESSDSFSEYDVDEKRRKASYQSLEPYLKKLFDPNLKKTFAPENSESEDFEIVEQNLAYLMSCSLVMDDLSKAVSFLMTYPHARQYFLGKITSAKDLIRRESYDDYFESIDSDEDVDGLIYSNLLLLEVLLSPRPTYCLSRIIRDESAENLQQLCILMQEKKERGSLRKYIVKILKRAGGEYLAGGGYNSVLLLSLAQRSLQEEILSSYLEILLTLILRKPSNNYVKSLSEDLVASDEKAFKHLRLLVDNRGYLASYNVCFWVTKSVVRQSAQHFDKNLVLEIVNRVFDVNRPPSGFRGLPWG